MIAPRTPIAMMQYLHLNKLSSPPPSPTMLSKRAAGPIPPPDHLSSDGGSIYAPYTSLPTQATSNSNSPPTPATLPVTTTTPDNDSSSNTIFGDDDDSDTTNNLVNMYFLILAAFVILLLFGLWYWRRGKKLKRIASLGRRRSALEHDLELGRRGERGGVRREEGVDEGGEAPPPYSATTMEAGTPDVDLAMPPRAHVRDGGPELPKYEELGREEQLARTPEGELVVAEEGELSREGSSPRAEDMETTGTARAEELARGPNVSLNPRAEEEDSGGGARVPSDAGASNAATVGGGGETVGEVVPGGSRTGTDRV